MAWGYQARAGGQFGRTQIPVALSSFIFCNVLGIALKGGKAKNFKELQSIVKASIAVAQGLVWMTRILGIDG